MTKPLIAYAGYDRSYTLTLTGDFDADYPRLAELLSYLQGLAPVGEPFEFKRDEVIADLGFGTRRSIYFYLTRLINKGLVR
jgi:hypothetical protein